MVKKVTEDRFTKVKSAESVHFCAIFLHSFAQVAVIGLQTPARTPE